MPYFSRSSPIDLYGAVMLLLRHEFSSSKLFSFFNNGIQSQTLVILRGAGHCYRPMKDVFADIKLGQSYLTFSLTTPKLAVSWPEISVTLKMFLVSTLTRNKGHFNMIRLGVAAFWDVVSSLILSRMDSDVMVRLQYWWLCKTQCVFSGIFDFSLTLQYSLEIIYIFCSRIHFATFDTGLWQI